MRIAFSLMGLFFLIGCNNHGKLKLLAPVPTILKEVSGVEKVKDSEHLWMFNDSGNDPILYKLDVEGTIQETLRIDAKNHDWEDITYDSFGNLYIADIGNNSNKRKNLRILKIDPTMQSVARKVKVGKIKYAYPEQHKFPPKKKKRYFDAESLIFHKGFLYVFTKSRVKNYYGKTSLYKIPAIPGNHKAEYIASFEFCNESATCWITAASISPDQSKIALLNHNTVFIFSDFTGDNFFNGTLKKYSLGHTSQKEGLVFKDNSTLYITDERSHGNGGNLYEFAIPQNESYME